MIKKISFILVLITTTIINIYSQTQILGNAGSLLKVEDMGVFNRPWAMTFISDDSLLISQQQGSLILYNTKTKEKVNVKGVPTVAYAGQGGLGDIILHPNYKNNSLVYLSYAEADSTGKKGAVVIRAKLSVTKNSVALENITKIWEQTPKVSGSNHYSHRLLFDKSGFLYITSGERQTQEPAQDINTSLGKVIRLYDNGETPTDNPFYKTEGVAQSIWSLGHRNLLGIALDNNGNIWAHEMGPRHGDELNLILKGKNYGWPIVSWGDHYSGVKIPDHDTRPDFEAPKAYWVPTIAPAGLVFYKGDKFPTWENNAIIGGLASQAIIRVKVEGTNAKEVERFSMNSRIREVELDSKGYIWVLQDGSSGKLLKLSLIK